MAAFLVLHIVLLIQFQLCMTAELTNPPVSESGFLYTTVEFSCKGIGDNLVWTVANYALTDAQKQEQNINTTTSNMNGNLSSNLTIPALPINNKIEIGCIVHSFYPTFMTAAKEVVLTVIGVSSAVNVKWHSDPNLLTWSPPLFYSNGSSNHAEFFYYILLNDVDMINTTNTSIYLNISNCAFFTICITVHTDQYASEENNQIYFDSGNYTVDIINQTVTFNHIKNAVNINLTNLVTFSDYVCNNTIYVTGSAINNKDGKQMIYPSLGINSNKSKEIILKYNIINLKQSSRYTIGIHVTDLYNTTEAQDNITISTYNVQDFSIDVNSNGSVTVTCVFMQGSINEHCYLIFLDAAQGIEKHFTVDGFKETNLTLTDSGNYTVEVYDIVDGAITGPAIEAPKLIEVIITSPSASSEQQSAMYATTSLSTSIITSSIITPTSSNNPSDILPSAIIITIAVFGVLAIMITVCLGLIGLICLCCKKRKKTYLLDLKKNTANKNEGSLHVYRDNQNTVKKMKNFDKNVENKKRATKI